MKFFLYKNQLDSKHLSGGTAFGSCKVIFPKFIQQPANGINKNQVMKENITPRMTGLENVNELLFSSAIFLKKVKHTN